jgi:hypothetical protein
MKTVNGNGAIADRLFLEPDYMSVFRSPSH